MTMTPLWLSLTWITESRPESNFIYTGYRQKTTKISVRKLNPPFKKISIYLFLERWEGRDKEWERNTDLLPLTCPPTSDLALQPRHMPWLESNWRPFSLWEDAQPTAPHQSGLKHPFPHYPKQSPHNRHPPTHAPKWPFMPQTRNCQ